MPRQLPLALSPEPGEAVDSWLEALARMYHVTFGVLRERVGIDLHYPSWVAQLDEASINNLAESTRVAPETIQDLTLQHYRDAALNTHPDKPTVEQLLVRRYNRSRYCPACLDESKGRWLLSWRLGWTFACPQHHCLLLDRCPACGQWQRHLWPPSHLESAPGHCARFQESNDSQVCNADLRAAEPIILKPKHRLMIAHNTIAEVIDGGTDTCGIYREQPCSSYDFLRDLRYLALRFLSLRNTELAETVIDEPSTSHLYLQEACRNGGLAAADRRFTQSALATGAAAHVALTVLHADGPDTASQRMALVLGLSNRRPRQQSYLSECPSISDQLSAVRIKAYEPYLGTTAQLRYRAHTKSPCFPTIHAGQLPGLAQSVPRLFWIPTVFKFQIPGARLSTLRPFLSAALLMIGTTADRIDILRLLDDTHPAPARIEHVAGRLRHSGHWPAIAEALTRIHDALVVCR